MPNLTNYVTRTETSRAEQEKLVKIFDLLVSLTISEEEVGQASNSIDMWSITVCAVENTVYIMEVCVVILCCCCYCSQMYPLIQEHVWAKVAGEEDLLRTVLDTFIRVSVCETQ